MLVNCNGDQVSLQVDRLGEALRSLGFEEHRVVVAVNETFVPKERWSSFQINAGDRLDVLSAIEGG